MKRIPIFIKNTLSIEHQTMAATAGQQQDTIDPRVEEAVGEFIRLDDETKRAKKQMKDVRDVVNGHKKTIVDYMTRSKIDRLTGIKGGTQFLECVEKTLKKRPTFDQMQAKMQELISQGVKNPTVIVEALQNCGGTYTEFRLSRRTRRISAATMAAAVAAGDKGLHSAGRKPPPPKKRKINVGAK